MSTSLLYGQKLAISGDSVAGVGWDTMANGLQSQINYARKIASAGNPNSIASVQATGVSLGMVVSVPAPLTYSMVGLPGATIAIMNSSYATYITAQLPFDRLILMIGINDFVAVTNPTAFQTSYLTLLDRIHGDAPNARIQCYGMMMAGEQWLTGPNRFSSGLGLTHPLELAIAASANARSSYCEYVSQCDWALAYEVANNTPSPGVNTGILMLDTLHPNAAGMAQMVTHAMATFTFPA